MSSFQDLGIFLFLYPCDRSTKDLCAVGVELQHRESMCQLHITPLGFCLMVIVDEKPLNLEKTTSSDLSVILINL